MNWSKTSPYCLTSDDGQYTISIATTAKGRTYSAVRVNGSASEHVGLIEGLPDDDSPAARSARGSAERELKNLCERHRIRDTTKGSGWSIYRSAGGNA